MLPSGRPKILNETNRNTGAGLGWNCQLEIEESDVDFECFGRPGPGRILDPIETSQFRELTFDASESDDPGRRRARDAF